MLSCVWLFVTPWLWPTRLLCSWIFQERILEWVAISYSRGSSPTRDRTYIGRQVPLPLHYLLMSTVLFWRLYTFKWASLVAQMVKNLPAVWETWIQCLGWEDPLEKETATHSSVLASEIPWTKESSRQKSMGSGRKRIRHDLVTKQQQYQLLFWCFFSCFFDAVA